uniref:Ig-like domain-containing protein n=1 Tax=Panagrolaimus superbus TaxID=310955 RepID=A0A914YLN1_9BILA
MSIQNLNNDQHFKQSIDNDGKAKLVIKDSSKADAGKYKVEATNPAGTAVSEAPLKIVPADSGKGEKAPEFTQQLKPAQTKEGETIVFDCKVDGHPPPTVAWFKDGQELKADERIKLESTSDGRQKLIIEKAKIDDQGNYKVVRLFSKLTFLQ